MLTNDINDKAVLFSIFFVALNFPSYFGWNWDALYDFMIDLSWVNEYEIQLIHDNVPFNNNEVEIRKYFEFLDDISSSWQKVMNIE